MYKVKQIRAMYIQAGDYILIDSKQLRVICVLNEFIGNTTIKVLHMNNGDTVKREATSFVKRVTGLLPNVDRAQVFRLHKRTR